MLLLFCPYMRTFQMTFILYLNFLSYDLELCLFPSSYFALFYHPFLFFVFIFYIFISCAVTNLAYILFYSSRF